MNKQNPSMEQRLLDYYDGRLGEQESHDLQSWINASEENRRTARRIFSLLLATDTNRRRKKTDTESALEQVKAKGNIRSRRSAAGWWQWTQWAAAILFLPLVLLSVWQYSLLHSKGTAMPADDIEVRTNPGMTTRLTLPDSTRVWLNASSVLRYPARFDGQTRAVRLTGEAYFEVTKDPKHRFIVHTPQESAVEVYGTHFNVEAYPDAPYITTTLTEGKVGFVHAEGNTTLRTPMEAGEKLRYDVRTHELTRTRTSGTSELSWKEGLIIFEDTPIQEALRMLEKRFHVDFTIRNSNLEDDRFTGTFSTQRLEKILKFFEISTGIRWRYLNNPDLGQEKLNIEIY